MQDFRQLKVWEKAHALTLDIYKASKAFPREEAYGLMSQMRRAAVSIAANIAEGACRGGDPDFARFLQIAFASASELEYHCLLASELQMLKCVDYQRLTAETTEVKRMLATLIHKLRADS